MDEQAIKAQRELDQTYAAFLEYAANVGKAYLELKAQGIPAEEAARLIGAMIANLRSSSS